MQNETFEPGQELYLENGNQAEYVCPVEYGHIVREVYDIDGEPWTSDPMFVHHVFTDPPKVKQEQRVAELDAEIEEKEKKLREVSSAIWDAQNSQKKMLEVLKRNEALAQIENTLDGKITHVAIKRWASWDLYEISSEAYRNFYTPPVFQIRIDFKDKSIKWGYKVESEDRLSCDCFPFPCKEEAITFIQQQVLSEAKEEELAKMHSHSIENIVNNAKKWQASIPDCFIAAYRQNQLEAAQKAQATAQAELDKANKALAALKETNQHAQL